MYYVYLQDAGNSTLDVQGVLFAGTAGHHMIWPFLSLSHIFAILWHDLVRHENRGQIVDIHSKIDHLLDFFPLFLHGFCMSSWLLGLG